MSLRKSVVAFLLSLPCAGLGHLYSGRVKTALGLVVAQCMLILAIAALYGFSIISYEVMLSCAISASIIQWILVPSHAAFISLKKKKATKISKKYFFLFFAFTLAMIFTTRSVERRLFFWPFNVGNNSMKTAVPIGSCILAKRMHGLAPKTGDLVVWKHKGSYFVSRVVGIPGDEKPVHLEANHFYLMAEEPGHLDSDQVGPIHLKDIVGVGSDVIQPFINEGFLTKLSFLNCIGTKK